MSADYGNYVILPAEDARKWEEDAGFFVLLYDGLDFQDLQEDQRPRTNTLYSEKDVKEFLDRSGKKNDIHETDTEFYAWYGFWPYDIWHEESRTHFIKIPYTTPGGEEIVLYHGIFGY